MTLTIVIDPETGERSIAAETSGMIPAVVHGSVMRMARHLAVLREVHHGVDVDTVFYTDFAFTDD